MPLVEHGDQSGARDSPVVMIWSPGSRAGKVTDCACADELGYVSGGRAFKACPVFLFVGVCELRQLEHFKNDDFAGSSPTTDRGH